MAITATQLVARVAVEGDAEAKQKLGEVDKKVKESEGGFKEFLKHSLEMAGVFKAFEMAGEGVNFLKEQFVDSIKSAIDHQQIMAQTNQVLKSTRDVSGMTGESLDNLATAFSKTTKFSADTVQGGENLLLTFTNIGKSVFPQATQAILDVSQAMGQDLKESAIQVGKALGDPLTGMTALQRIGVTFSKDEKDQIKTMMAHNDIIGAQKIILHELATEFGGSATAAGKTFGGQLDILKNQFEEIKIKIGTALLPVLSDLLNKYVNPLVIRFSDWLLKGGGLVDIQNMFKTMANFLQTTFLPAMNDLLNKYILPLAQDVYDLFIKSGFLNEAWSTLSGILGTILPIIGNFVSWVLQGGPGVTALGVAIAGVATIVAGFKLASWLSDVNKGVLGVIDNFGKWKQTASDFLSWFSGTFSGGAKQALDNVGKAATGAGDSVSGIGTAAQTAEGEVAAASTEEEASLASVGTSANIAKGDIAAIGPASETAATVGGSAFAAFGAGMVSVGIGAIFAIESYLLKDALPALIKSYGDPNYKPPSGPGGVSPARYNAAPETTTTPSLKRYASGVTNFEGGLAFVHAGEALVNMPRGTSVIPANQVSGGGGSAAPSGQPVVVQFNINSQQFIRAVMPDFVLAVRNATGVKF